MTSDRRVEVAALVVSAIAALGMWLLPQARLNIGQSEAPSLTPAQIAKQVEIKKPEDPLEREQATEAPTVTPYSKVTDAPRVSLRRDSPQEFTLFNGDQKVLCAGLMGIGATCTTVAGVDLLTLRINARETSTQHAVLAAGERFTARCDGKDLSISVTSLDFPNQKTTIRID